MKRVKRVDREHYSRGYEYRDRQRIKELDKVEVPPYPEITKLIDRMASLPATCCGIGCWESRL